MRNRKWIVFETNAKTALVYDIVHEEDFKDVHGLLRLYEDQGKDIVEIPEGKTARQIAYERLD